MKVAWQHNDTHGGNDDRTVYNKYVSEGTVTFYIVLMGNL